MLTKKKISFLIGTTLILTLIFGTFTYAAAGSDLATPITDPQEARYAILDGLNIGITFSNGNAYCHASGSAGAATKFIVRGTFHKYGTNGHLDLICNWPERTTHGQTFIFDEHALMVTPGKYLFTLYVDVYSGDQHEYLVFYKESTKS
ncbi:MAG: hypothetical protein HFI89_15475 [Lachnospiraceae bacterium]|nr:hypothetical protein [Lachnospiraceae bacterium]